MQIPLLSLLCVILLLPVCYSAFSRHYKLQSIKIQVGGIIILIVGGFILSSFYHVSLGSSARASQVSEEDSKAITLNLLKNVYRSFDFREEEDVYDKLAISVSGNLLTDIYLQSRKSMLIEQAGGAQAKVKQVEVLETDVQESKKQEGALDVRTKWTATGSVGHWGHIHTLQNLYDAILTLAVVDGSWKITGLEVLEEKRIDPFGAQQAK
jgi:hypothetical protein